MITPTLSPVFLLSHVNHFIIIRILNIQKRLENSPTCALLVLHVRILFTAQMTTEETSIPVFKVFQSREPTEQGSYLYKTAQTSLKALLIQK